MEGEFRTLKGCCQSTLCNIDLLTVMYGWLQLTGGIDDRACWLLMTRLKMMLFVAVYGCLQQNE